MLNQYKSKLAEYEGLRKKYSTTNRLIAVALKDKEATNNKLKDIEQKRDRYYERIKDDLLEEEEERFKYLLDEAKQIKNEVGKLEKQNKEEVANVTSAEFDKANQKYYKLLEELKTTIELIRESVKELVIEDKEIGDSISRLSKLNSKQKVDDVVKVIKEDVEVYLEITQNSVARDNIMGLGEKAKNVLTFPARLEMSPKLKVSIYGLYIAGITLAFVNLSFLILVAGGIGINSVFKKKKEKEYTELIVKKVSDTVSMYQCIESELEAQKDKYLKQKISKINEKYKELINQKIRESDYKEKQYKVAVSNIKVDESVIQKRLDAKYNEMMSEIKEQLEEQNALIKQYQDDISKLKDSASECDKELQSLKNQITEVYWQLGSVGENKLMLKEFVLGFSERNLMCMETKEKPIVIVYDGESSEKNSILINMIIAQCLCNMLPNILFFNIVDCEYSCRDYMMYSSKELDFVFKFNTLDSKILAEIAQMHEELCKRQRDISPVANNIEEYNKLMIERQSFTYEYSIFILQSASDRILSDAQFKQICRTGPQFGILPIVFIDRGTYTTILNEQDETKKRIYNDFFESAKGSSWAFNQRTLDLEDVKLGY